MARELSTKIGVTAQICDARETLNLLRDEDARGRGFAIIGSIQGLRPPRSWEDDENEKPAARLARFLRSMEGEDRLVDLLIVDEAHHFRNSDTQNRKLGQLCKGVAEYAVFLTATPIHNGNSDLLSLLRLLDPDTFSRPETFSQILEANAPLVRARDLILRPDPDVGAFRELLESAQSHPTSPEQPAVVDDTDGRPCG